MMQIANQKLILVKKNKFNKLKISKIMTHILKDLVNIYNTPLYLLRLRMTHK